MCFSTNDTFNQGSASATLPRQPSPLIVPSFCKKITPKTHF